MRFVFVVLSDLIKKAISLSNEIKISTEHFNTSIKVMNLLLHFENLNKQFMIVDPKIEGPWYYFLYMKLKSN